MEWLTNLVDAICDQLPQDEARATRLVCMNAAQLKNSSEELVLAKHKFLQALCVEMFQYAAVASGASGLHQRLVSGDNPSEREWLGAFGKAQTKALATSRAESSAAWAVSCSAEAELGGERGLLAPAQASVWAIGAARAATGEWHWGSPVSIAAVHTAARWQAQVLLNALR